MGTNKLKALIWMRRRTDNLDIHSILKEKRAIVDAHLERYLTKADGAPDAILQAMRYSLFAGGKRLRPILAMAGCELCHGLLDDVMPLACAIEMIHTYSLIHDDLPAMDNDDYRRGRPTNHKVFGEGMAVLAGDGLLNYAFEIMLDGEFIDSNRLKAVRLVAQAAGIRGMIGGQVMDLQLEGKEARLDQIEAMHRKKTGALIDASVLAGAIAAGCSEQQYRALAEFSSRIGLAFQITDDILDVIGDEKVMGKKAGSDAIKAKPTYATILGIENSRKKVEKLAREAKEYLETFGQDAAFLVALTDYLVNRDY
jgi:geranylgeranyl diphosphate synthase type II